MRRSRQDLVSFSSAMVNKKGENVDEAPSFLQQESKLPYFLHVTTHGRL